MKFHCIVPCLWVGEVQLKDIGVVANAANAFDILIHLSHH